MATCPPAAGSGIRAGLSPAKASLSNLSGILFIEDFIYNDFQEFNK
jgi:hypothetical protein